MKAFVQKRDDALLANSSGEFQLGGASIIVFDVSTKLVRKHLNINLNVSCSLVQVLRMTLGLPPHMKASLMQFPRPLRPPLGIIRTVTVVVALMLVVVALEEEGVVVVLVVAMVAPTMTTSFFAVSKSWERILAKATKETNVTKSLHYTQHALCWKWYPRSGVNGWSICCCVGCHFVTSAQ